MAFSFSVGETGKLPCFYALFYANAQVRTAKKNGCFSRRKDRFIDQRLGENADAEQT